jgi:hypothetical protein
MRKWSSLKQNLATASVLALALVSSVNAISRDDVCEPVVKFIDFYIATQDAEAPPMSLWEKVVYGLAIAQAPDRPRETASTCNR